MNSLFSRIGLLAVFGSLLLLPVSAVAEIHSVSTDAVVINPLTTYMDSTDSVVVNGGQFQNGITGFYGRYIANITVNSGIGRNGRESVVTGLVNVLGGEFANEGTVASGIVSGGTFMNNAGGIVLGSLLMNDGKVNNGGTINNFVYGGGGEYEAFGNGNIGNLSLDAGQQFNVNRLAGIANTFGVGSIDLAGADLVWNLNGSLGDNLGFFGWGDIFGVDFTGGEKIALFTVNWDGGSAIFNADNFGQTLTFGNYEIIASTDGVTASATPEPATLVVLGLGLAGLGLVRRRKM